MNGESEVRMINLTDGKLIRKKKLPTQDFGEGLVRSQDRCVQAVYLPFRSILGHSDTQNLHTGLFELLHHKALPFCMPPIVSM